MVVVFVFLVGDDGGGDDGGVVVGGDGGCSCVSSTKFHLTNSISIIHRLISQVHMQQSSARV